MLKITVRHGDKPVLVLEGRLAGPWVEEAREVWRRFPGEAPAVVDLTAVTFVDKDGKALLATMWRDGAELRAAGCCTKFLVEEITGRRTALS